MSAVKKHPSRQFVRLYGRQAQGGFSLIELLVAVVIGLALVLAITGILVRSETGRRSLTSSNDVSQTSAYVAYTLDRSLRSVGTGFAQSWRESFGCRLLASRSATQILPRAAAFPAPFATVPTTLRLAPLVVHAGAGAGGSDVLALSTGASGLGEAPLVVLEAGSTALRTPSTLGLRENDLVLVLQDTTNCMLQQVVAGFAGGADQTLSLGGTYADSEIDSVKLEDFGVGKNALVAPLGNTVGNLPEFQLVGVADNATLVSYDLLRLDGSDAVTPIADGVLDIRAVYGVDTNNDGVIDTWVRPTAAPWTAAALLDGSVAARDNLRSILAVRVAVILRSSLPERTAVSNGTITLFDDLALTPAVSRSFTGAEQQQRYRVVDFTVPLRNIMLAPRI
jgi:type IV pilus assembly protein PilW